MAYAANLGRGDIVYPGLIAAWSAKGKSNDDEDRAILKDLTGNGHDISLNGFAFSEMSGYWGYPINFTKVFNYDVGNKTAIIMHKIGKVHANLGIFYGLGSQEIPSIKIKVTGISNTNANLRYKYVENETDNNNSYYDMNEDGVYTLPKSVISPNATTWKGFTVSQTVENIDLTIELLPEYPDALVFDGVDDYGINEDVQALTDFTIILQRRILTLNAAGRTVSKGSFKGSTYNNAVFSEGNGGLPSANKVQSFGQDTIFNDIPQEKSIIYLTPTNYIGRTIKKGTYTDKDNTRLLFGVQRLDLMDTICNMAFYSAYLFDRSLDEQEIKAFIRKYIDPQYLLPSEIEAINNSLVAKYECYDKTNEDEDRDILADLSGNGHDMQLYNFAFTEESGFNKSTYKGALVSDGVDDYCRSENFPILRNFTIIALRKYLVTPFRKMSGFMEYKETYSYLQIENYNSIVNTLYFYNYGKDNAYRMNYDYFKEPMVCSTNKYQNEIATQGNNFPSNNQNLNLFETATNRFSNMALYALEIYDRDLTDKEIAVVKARMIKTYEEKTGNKYIEEVS